LIFIYFSFQYFSESVAAWRHRAGASEKKWKMRMLNAPNASSAMLVETQAASSAVFLSPVIVKLGRWRGLSRDFTIAPEGSRFLAHNGLKPLPRPVWRGGGRADHPTVFFH
jgi:hypothetical protein